MDIEALSILTDRKKDLTSLPDPLKSDATYDKCGTVVTITMSRTMTTIQEVSSYAEQITKELQNIQKLIKLYSIKVGEQMKKLMKNILLKGKIVRDGKIVNDDQIVMDGQIAMDGKIVKGGQIARDGKIVRGGKIAGDGQIDRDADGAPIEGRNNDMKHLEQVQTMQTLAKQQQELMKLIANTNELMFKMESNAALSMSDISALEELLNQWCNTVETLEEQKQRIREEKEKEEKEKREKKEREKREKEETERQRKEKVEKEKREKEEAKRRQKEKEEREKREKEEAKRRQKEKAEREKREKEEAKRRQKEKAEREKREKEEPGRPLKEKEERENREQPEVEIRQNEQEERDKRETGEAERRKGEEREAAEKKRRQEEEQKRRDWKNWPPFVFENAKTNKFNQDICCVVFTMPDEIQQSDLTCKASDAEHDLDLGLDSNDEQVISSLITIKPTNDKQITFQMPTRVYAPVVSYDQKLDAKLKFRINRKDKWRTEKSLPDVQLAGVSNVTFVGVEIPVETFQYVECIAVARYKRYEIEVDTGGKIFEPEGDRNIKVKFPPNSFPAKTTVATKIIPLTHRDINNASKKNKELQNIKTAGLYIDISCENSTKEDTDLEMYDFGWVVDKNPQKQQSVTQETLTRCSRWLVNNMNPDENTLQLDDFFDSDFLGELKAEESQGDKNRHILRTLHDVSDSDFDKFVFCLNVSQPEVANRIRNVRKQVKLSRKSNDTNYEDNFASDFDTDFERKEGTVCVVSKLTGKTWKIVSIEASDEHPKARFLKLPAGSDQFQVLGLVVPEGMSHEDICRAAEILEGLNCVTNVSVICRQKHANAHDVIIECVRSENVADTIHHLNALGYNDGPPESSEFGVVDGEEIDIKMEHNLRLEEYMNSSLKLKFYKNIASERYSGHLAVVNKKDQWEDQQYHGYLSHNVSSGRLSMPRRGKMILYVPKPLEEIVGNFPYTMNVPVKALAKFIAWQLTKDNFNSTRWVKHAGYLTDLDKHLYHQIVKYIDNEIPGAPQRDRYELFIMYWANNHAHFDTDKIGKIIAAHHDKGLESETQKFIKPYIPGKGLLSNDNLEKMSYVVSRDWENMAKQLGFSSEEINQIKSSQHGNVRQTLRMPDVWRLSCLAIQKGTDLVKSLHETAKSAQCGAKLLSMISNHM